MNLRVVMLTNLKLSLTTLKKDMKELQDQDEGERINAFDAVKVETKSEVQAGFLPFQHHKH